MGLGKSELSTGVCTVQIPLLPELMRDAPPAYCSDLTKELNGTIFETV